MVLKYQIILLLVALIILSVFLYFMSFNKNTVVESMTNQEAGAIMPVLYDSALSSKTKITDLLGIPVNDASYNQILNSNNKDSDSVVTAIKQYIGSIVNFSNTNGGAPGIESTTKSIDTSATATTASTTDATTTKPLTLGVSHKSFTDRIADAAVVAANNTINDSKK